MNRNRPSGSSDRRRTGRSIAAARAARRKRIRWITAVAVIVVIVGGITALRLVNRSAAPSASGTGQPVVGAAAVDGSFTTVDGKTETVASLRGQPTLLWFVATWCPSCQAGTSAVAQEFPQLRAAKLKVVEVELYQNFGQSGPSIQDFGKSEAGTRWGDPNWIFGTSSQQLTNAYDTEGASDIYYLLDPSGRVAYVNSSPAATLPDLLAHAARLT